MPSRRRLLAYFVFLSALVCLAACGGPDAPPAPGGDPDPATGAPAQARDYRIAPELTIGDAIAGPATRRKTEPAVAFGGTMYLVVWSDHRDGLLDMWDSGGPYSRLYAARVALDGTLLDPQGIELGWGFAPAVSFDGASFLVVASTGGAYSLYGLRVDPSGAVLAPGWFPIAPGNFATQPEVAFAGQNHVVVFGCNNGYTCLARVTPDGAVLDPGGVSIGIGHAHAVASSGAGALVVHARNSLFGTRGTRLGPDGQLLDLQPFDIVPLQNGEGPWSVAAAFDGANYVVAATYATYDNPSVLLATRVTPAGGVLDAPPLLLAEDNVDAEPFAFLALAWNGQSTSVFWSQYRWDTAYAPLHAVRLSPGGVILDASPISVSPYQTGTAPAAASNGAGAFVAWVDPRGEPSNIGIHPDVVASRVGSDGTILDQPSALISRSGNAQWLPAAAEGGGLSLVAWVDGRDDGEGIHAARLTAAGEVLDPAGIPIGLGPGFHRNPRVVFDGQSFLVLWHHAGGIWGGDDSYDPECWDVLATRVSAAGVAMDPAPIDVGLCDGGIGVSTSRDDAGMLVVGLRVYGGQELMLDAARVDPQGVVTPVDLSVFGTVDYGIPAVSFDGQNHLIAWRAGEILRAARVSPAGVALDLPSLTITTELGSSAAAVFDGQNHVLVWEGAAGVMAARVTPQGDVLDPQGFVIAPQQESAARYDEPPFVAVWDGERTLVAWPALADPADPRSADLLGVTLDAAGVAGNVFAISAEPDAERMPALAALGAGRALSVYTRYAPEPGLQATRLFARYLCDGTCAGGEGGAGGGGGAGGSGSGGAGGGGGGAGGGGGGSGGAGGGGGGSGGGAAGEGGGAGSDGGCGCRVGAGGGGGPGAAALLAVAMIAALRRARSKR